MNRTEFLSRFLDQLRDDWSYSPPTPDTIQQASVAAIDEVGFDAHRTHFIALAEIIDACAIDDGGVRNAMKHPQVVALTQLDAPQRAGIAAAAAQGIVWMELCRQWVQGHTPKNQVALRIMTAILVMAGRVRSGYSASQLAALARLGACSHDMDLFVIRARGAIAEILAANSSELPCDEGMRIALKRFLDFTATYPHNVQSVVKAINKLMPLTAHESAA